MISPYFTVQDQLFIPGPAFLLAPTDRYRLFARQVLPQIQKTRLLLSQCYCAQNGRPGVEPVLLLALLVLQFWEGVPDRKAVELLNYHCGWAFAVGWEIGRELFDACVLPRFRQRLLKNHQASLVFDQIIHALVEAGFLKPQASRRLDSTLIVGLVSQMGRLECVRESLRLALQELHALGATEKPAARWPLWWERYVENQLDYRTDPSLLQTKLQQAGEDLVDLFAWVDRFPAGAWTHGPKLKVLRRVFAEQFEPAPEGAAAPAGMLPRPKEKTPAGAVKNPHDPEAQWMKKGNGPQKKEVVGYKVQVSETVSETPLAKGQPTAQFLLALETQLATASDERGMAQVCEAEARLNLPPAPIRYVDAAYVSAAQLAQAKAEHRELIGPAPAPPSREGRYSAAAFEITFTPLAARCPAGHRHAKYDQWQDREMGGLATRFDWAERCAHCPLRPKCISPEQTSRTLAIGPNHELLQARRREQTTPEFAARCRHRNALEGTQSELVRGHGLRRARYRGLEKVCLQNYFIGAACNVKRWIHQLQWQAGQPQGECAQN
jgi:transposase